MNSNTFLKQYDALLLKHGSQRAIATALGIPRTTIQRWLERREDILFTERPVAKPVKLSAPTKGVKRYIFTAAQSESAIHEEFLTNLEAYAAYLNAEIHIASFTYEKRLYEHSKRGKAFDLFPEAIKKYMTDYRFEIGENLVFCGNMNTLPTAQTPLAGFEVYTGGRDGIFPHAKVQLVSVPTMKDEPAKIIMTTGVVTKRNYIQRRNGILAEFHHIIGAVLVEIDKDGDHFCRHLLANEEDGSFQDLDIFVSDGLLVYNQGVEAINWGDIHIEKMDDVVAASAWGISEEIVSNTMLDDLTPKFQFLHDSIDNFPHDPHFRYEMWLRGTESISDMVSQIGNFIEKVSRPWCQTVIVESNHDKAALKWMKTADWREDPVNAELYLMANLEALQCIRAKEKFSFLGWSLRETDALRNNVKVLFEDESFVICNGKIECGMHGHLGANGAKGHPKAFSRMGRRANTGHTHSAGIIDGIYTAGVSGKLDMGYNSGLSSWSHSHIVTYDSGKRVIITMKNGKWRA